VNAHDAILLEHVATA